MDQTSLDEQSFRKTIRTLRMPIALQMEITYRCNLRCRHCYNKSGRYSPANRTELSDSDWMTQLRKFDLSSMTNVVISGGEPFLKRSLIKSMVRHLSRFPTAVVWILTNGWFFNEEMAKYLSQFRPPAQLQISVDGATPGYHDRIRGVSGSWDRAVRAINIAVSYGLPVKIAHTVNKWNREGVEEIFLLAAAIGADELLVGHTLPLGAGKRKPQGFLLNTREKLELNVQLQDLGIKSAYSAEKGHLFRK